MLLQVCNAKCLRVIFICHRINKSFVLIFIGKISIGRLGGIYLLIIYQGEMTNYYNKTFVKNRINTLHILMNNIFTYAITLAENFRQICEILRLQVYEYT